MLALKLRQEFETGSPKAIVELAEAIQTPAVDFLAVTYPTTDLLRMLKAVGRPDSRPTVLLGERGQGKSHLLATLHHALTNPAAVQAWLAAWAPRLANPAVAAIPTRPAMFVISEAMQQQEYNVLWDLLFDRHPRGTHIRGKWEGIGAKQGSVPPKSLLVELVTHTPTTLILDEFQVWYDGKIDSDTSKARTWNFNFVQLLSEVANEHPDKLVLAVSVRRTDTDAYEQLHRHNPERIDFKGETAKADRQKLLLHRLFENRANISDDDVGNFVQVAVAEKLRIRHLSVADADKVLADYVGTWPFSPDFLTVLEDQVLVSTSAQETRDMIGVLAMTFRAHGHLQAILTPADLRIDDAEAGAVKLLDSVNNPMQQRLREKALRNLEAAKETIPDWQTTVPFLPEVLTALWVRSLAVGNQVGATQQDLQLDLTRGKAFDDGPFSAGSSAEEQCVYFQAA